MTSGTIAVADPAELQALWDVLPPVEIDDLRGLWRGRGMPTGHFMGRVLVRSGYPAASNTSAWARIVSPRPPHRSGRCGLSRPAVRAGAALLLDRDDGVAHEVADLLDECGVRGVVHGRLLRLRCRFSYRDEKTSAFDCSRNWAGARRVAASFSNQL